MNIGAYIFAALAAIAYYLFLTLLKKRKTAKLSKGFEFYAGKPIGEKELLRILVLEELERYRQDGKVVVAPSRKKRAILTGCYILLNFVLLMSMYWVKNAPIALLMLAVPYIHLYHAFDPVSELCKAVKAQPDRNISQIVLEMVNFQSARGSVLLGIGAFVLSIALFFSLNTKDRYTFAPTEGGYCLERYRPAVISSTEVHIPERYEGEAVVAIGQKAFANIARLRKVYVPETVVLIDSYAFRDCHRLQEISLPEGLQALNGESFKNCKRLRKIVIPEGVTEIRGNTFEGCRNLEEVVLHDGILVIHGYAFRGCRSLKTIDLPPGITEIRAYTFENCSALREIDIPEGVTRIGAHAFKGCRKLERVSVPWSLGEIRSSAFRECSDLKEIVLPKNTVVDERAFKDCPAKIYRKKFTAVEWKMIQEEAENKKAEILYYVYQKDAPDEILGQADGTILIVDDARYAQKLDESQGLQALETDAQALEYLRAAKAAGFTLVTYMNYSETATRYTGEDYFVQGSITVDKMIENRIAEENDG